MWQSPSDHSLPEQLLLGGADCTAVLHFRNLTTTWPLFFFFFLSVFILQLNAETAPWLLSQKPVQKPAAASSSFL